MRWTRADTVLALLVLATVASAWLGEGAAAGGRHLDVPTTVAVLVLAAVKGSLIALDYMELLRAPALWRRVVMGWLVVVLGIMAMFSVALRA
jgi:hypothetical protein